MGEGFKAVIFTGTFEGWVSARDSVSVIAGDPLKKLVLRGSCQIADGDLVRTREAPAVATEPDQ